MRLRGDIYTPLIGPHWNNTISLSLSLSLSVCFHCICLSNYFLIFAHYGDASFLSLSLPVFLSVSLSLPGSPFLPLSFSLILLSVSLAVYLSLSLSFLLSLPLPLY